MPPHPPAEAARLLRDLALRWRTSTLGEKQAFQHWFLEFCDALGAARPSPNAADDYCFEKPVHLQRTDWTDGVGRIDCWKAGHVAIEAKGSGGKGSSEIHLRKAFKQLSDYVAAEPGTVPPYLIVVDVPRELIVWEGWRGGFGGFAAGRRIVLDLLPDRPDDIALLQDILERPHVRDPRGKAQRVTRDIAGKLAELAATFEDRGFESERVARFLMRCVFCFFAEDVGLLPKKLFKRTLESARNAGGPDRVAAVLTNLWRTMDAGGDFGADVIKQFNGHFFVAVESLPLEAEDVALLIEAAGFDWSDVEPSIFGTLLVRALEPGERHKLGAEYTPREYIERLVEPTVIEPIRERWTAVQARVVQLEAEAEIAAIAKKIQAKAMVSKATSRKVVETVSSAEREILAFHKWLRSLRFLDPACGSGNFLYVTLAAVKRLELEVLAELARLRGGLGGLVLEEVHPRQFYGIEINWWAREIAELTLWIGYHQFWRSAHGEGSPKAPILEDTGTIRCRDAILAWDEIVHRPEKDRPDPTPRIVHPVTGELVPDPQATLPYMEYVGARQAEWPPADFIVGNPPYLGKGRQREALGDGYVAALRQAYQGSVPEGADLVMYWWSKASRLIAGTEAIRAGLITTNSIVQPQNRRVVEDAQATGTNVVWAVRDHPWVEGGDGAAVRVAMTVLSQAGGAARLYEVAEGDSLKLVATSRRLNADLTPDVDVATATDTPLISNDGLAGVGFGLYGAGFILDPSSEADWS